jgi:hypothetical protein
MHTVRVPLSSFPASLDRSDVQAVTLRLDFGNLQGCVLLDSIEFTN